MLHQLCRCCLSTGHLATNCPEKKQCTECNRPYPHHKLVCYGPPQLDKSKPVQTASQSANSAQIRNSFDRTIASRGSSAPRGGRGNFRGNRGSRGGTSQRTVPVLNAVGEVIDGQEVEEISTISNSELDAELQQFRSTSAVSK